MWMTQFNKEQSLFESGSVKGKKIFPVDMLILTIRLIPCDLQCYNQAIYPQAIYFGLLAYKS